MHRSWVNMCSGGHHSVHYCVVGSVRETVPKIWGPGRGEKEGLAAPPVGDDPQHLVRQSAFTGFNSEREAEERRERGTLFVVSLGPPQRENTGYP